MRLIYCIYVELFDCVVGGTTLSRKEAALRLGFWRIIFVSKQGWLRSLVSVTLRTVYMLLHLQSLYR